MIRPGVHLHIIYNIVQNHTYKQMNSQTDREGDSKLATHISIPTTNLCSYDNIFMYITGTITLYSVHYMHQKSHKNYTFNLVFVY